ncbi:MAG: C25 family cysteine peptidase [Planctomycetota bacterium]
MRSSTCWIGSAGLCLAMAAMMATAAAADDTWYAVAPDGTLAVINPALSGSTTVSVQASSNEALRLTIEVPALAVGSQETQGGKFTSVYWPGAATYGEIGCPRLPVVRRFFIAPNGATVTLSATAGEGFIIDSAAAGRPLVLPPVQRPVPKIPGALENAPFDFDKAAYALDSAYPSQRASIEEAGVVRGQRLILLTVHPIAYNPDGRTITYYPNISVDIAFEQAGPIVGARRQLPGFANLVLNPEIIPAAPRAADDYLIVVADAFASDISSFVSFKESQGYDVATYSVPAGTSNTVIKSYIQGLWGTADEPSYILLIGDTDTIPHWTGGGEGTPATDIQYACMDGASDWHPDIAIGRFPARTTVHLNAMIDKTMDIESGNWGDPTYAERAVFMASSDNHDITEGTHDYVIGTYLDGLGIASTRLWYYDGATTQQVSDAFNAGQVYGIYSGHGGTYSWADGPPFSQDNVRALTNYQMYPFVCSFACITGTYTVDECYTETWIREAGKGAATIYGSSVNSYWDEDDILERRLFDVIYGDGVPANGVREVSPAWQAAEERLFLHYGDTSTVRRYFEMYNLMGDPSLYIPEPGGGADMAVMPTSGLQSEGTSGGPFVPSSKVYTLTNNAGTAISYSVSSAQTWVDITNPSGTIPIGGDVQVTVSIGAEADGFTQGHYEATVDFVNNTSHDGDATRNVVLDVGRTLISVDPETGLVTGGAEGGPFTGSVTYRVTSGRPSPVDVRIDAGAFSWISLDGAPGPLDFTLTGTGDYRDVEVGIDATEAGLLAVGVYNGTVSFTNLTSGEGNTTRPVTLEVGRVVYAATDVPQPITDYSTITSEIEVTDDFCIGDVDVEMDITHTYIGDLVVELASPGGTVVRLHNRTGGTTDNIVTTYDEPGGTLPDGPGTLADFNLTNVQGTWTLTVSDQAGGDTGTLNGWTLRVVPAGEECPTIEVIHSFPLDADPGWATTGQWAFGTPTGGGGSYGDPDPTSGFTGNNVYGYNLNGDYANSLSSIQYLTTSAIDCTDATNTRLLFRRWLGVESATYDHANIQVSNNGSTWTPVWDHSGGSTSDGAWALASFDISSVADEQSTVYIRWGMGTTDGSITYCGWNIDDIEIWGVSTTESCLNGPGDMDGIDGVNGVDIQAFVDCCMGGDPEASGCACADVHNDGSFQADDIAEFVDCLIDGVCP